VIDQRIGQAHLEPRKRALRTSVASFASADAATRRQRGLQVAQQRARSRIGGIEIAPSLISELPRMNSS